MKKIVFSALVVAAAGLVVICLIVGKTPKPVSSTYFLMDTVLTVKTTGKNAETINRKLYALASGVDEMTSCYKPGSETARVNAAGGLPVTISEEYSMLLKAALHVQEIARGTKFDIAISPVSSLWGFTTKEFRVPTAEEIARVLQYSHSDQVILDGTTVTLHDARARIDLGGMAKGYSLDVMAEYLQKVQPQPEQVIVDFGGNLLLYSGGKKHNWKIGIRDPRGEGIIGYMVSDDAFVATSGDYQRYFESDGQRYCHIIDPVTGYPAVLNRSATVITSIKPMHAAIGDALGKVFFCSVPSDQEAEFEMTRQDGVVGAVLIDAEGHLSVLGNIAFAPESGT